MLQAKERDSYFPPRCVAFLESLCQLAVGCCSNLPGNSLQNLYAAVKNDVKFLSHRDVLSGEKKIILPSQDGIKLFRAWFLFNPKNHRKKMRNSC